MPTATQLPADQKPTQLPAERRSIRERLELLRDLINNQNTEPHGLNWGQATAIARDLDAIVNDIPEGPGEKREKPDQSLPGEKPGRPDRPDQGLPGDRPERPDQGLPGERPRPDQELPETPDPKRGQSARRI